MAIAILRLKGLHPNDANPYAKAELNQSGLGVINE